MLYSLSLLIRVALHPRHPRRIAVPVIGREKRYGAGSHARQPHEAMPCADIHDFLRQQNRTLGLLIADATVAGAATVGTVALIAPGGTAASIHAITRVDAVAEIEPGLQDCCVAASLAHD